MFCLYPNNPFIINLQIWSIVVDDKQILFWKFIVNYNYEQFLLAAYENQLAAIQAFTSSIASDGMRGQLPTKLKHFFLHC